MNDKVLYRSSSTDPEISGKSYNAGSLPVVEYNRSPHDTFQTHMVSPTSRNSRRATRHGGEPAVPSGGGTTLQRFDPRCARQVTVGLLGIRACNAAVMARHALIERMEETAARGVYRWEIRRGCVETPIAPNVAGGAHTTCDRSPPPPHGSSQTESPSPEGDGFGRHKHARPAEAGFRSRPDRRLSAAALRRFRSLRDLLKASPKGEGFHPSPRGTLNEK